MANDYIGRYTGNRIDELLAKADTGVYSKAEADTLLSGKVDKVSGKGLSTNDYTTAEKTKLAGLENYDDTSLSNAVSSAVNSGAKNCLRIMVQSQTVNGVTVTIDSDGVFTLSGTATADITDLRISTGLSISPGRKKLTGCPEGGSDSTYRLDVFSTTSSVIAKDYGSGCEFNAPASGVIQWVRIRIAAGQVCDGLVFRPMIRDAAISDETFQPYAPTNSELYRMIQSLTQ